MTANPLISVVIPSFDHERFVGAAIESVYRQSYRPLELVVVDDGSKDGSRRVISSLLSDCPLERGLLVEQPNAGAHAALNRGIAEAAGGAIAILNSDDLYHPERLARLAAALDGRSSGLAFSHVELVDEAGGRLAPESPWWAWYEKALSATRECPSLGFALLLANAAVSSSNLLFTREVWERVGPFGSHRFCHDWDFLMRSVLVTEPVLVEEALLRYRVHATNSTESLRGVQEAEVADALNRYLRLAVESPAANPLAPTPHAWPHLLPLFIAGRKFHFGTRAIGDYVLPALRDRLLAVASGITRPPGPSA